MMAKRHKAFRRAALLLSAAARLWRHIFIAMIIIAGSDVIEKEIITVPMRQMLRKNASMMKDS